MKKTKKSIMLALCVILFGLSHATAIESSIIFIDPDTTTVSPNQSDYTPDAKIGKSQNELYNKNRINLPTNVISTGAFYVQPVVPWNHTFQVGVSSNDGVRIVCIYSTPYDSVGETIIPQ